MAIVKMKHLRLIAMAEDRPELLRLLQNMGCVEIVAPELNGGQQEADGLTAARTEELFSVQEEHTGAERALSVLKRYAPEKKGLLTPLPEVSREDLFDAGQTGKAREAATEINALERRLTAIQSEEAKLAQQIGVLTPWKGLDLPLETESTDQVMIQLGTLPAAVPFEEAENRLKEAGELTELEQVGVDRSQQYCLLVCHTSRWEALQEPLKDLGWSKSGLRDWQGTAQENITRLERELNALEEEKAEIWTKLSGMAAARSGLERFSDRMAAEVARAENWNRLADTEQTFLLEGWVPEERWPELKGALEPWPCAFEVSDPEPEDYPDVPVQLKNNPITEPMNMVTEMYSLPAYDGIDPNPLMAPFFVLFYGMMMADMGYGLLMLLLGTLILKKKKPTGTMAHLAGLLVQGGVTTFLFGAVTGGFFGDFIPQLMGILNPGSTFALPALFTPVDDTLAILIGSLALGLVQIFTGMAVSFVRKLKSGQVLDALFEEVTWWVILIGLALAVLGITPLLFGAGGVLLVAGCVRKGVQKGGGPGKILLNSLVGLGGALYSNITGYFQDILSYSRLMALMLSGAVVAQVFNTLGAIPKNVFVFVVISMVGNALNFALNLLGCYVHDMRLQCLEYFNRFYQDGGKPFRPLRFTTKYVQIEE